MSEIDNLDSIVEGPIEERTIHINKKIKIKINDTGVDYSIGMKDNIENMHLSISNEHGTGVYSQNISNRKVIDTQKTSDDDYYIGIISFLIFSGFAFIMCYVNVKRGNEYGLYNIGLILIPFIAVLVIIFYIINKILCKQNKVYFYV